MNSGPLEIAASRTKAARGWELPVVRDRALPPDSGGVLEWRDGPDFLAATAVAVVGAIAASLGVSSMTQDLTPTVVAAAVCLAGLGIVAVLAALGEFLRVEHIRIEDDCVRVTRRGLSGWQRWQVPLDDYLGLEPLDRRRRFHVRNQRRPGGSLQAAVTEFVVTLRHPLDGGRDLELFRAQPSLGTLRAMHAVRTAGGRGGASAAQACEQAARRYRDALASLCHTLDLPVLIAASDGSRQPVSLHDLDPWLERAHGDATATQ